MGSIQPRRWLLNLALSLTERPGCQLDVTAAVRELPNTQIGIRIMRSLRKSLINVIVHHPFPLISRDARVIQFYRQAGNGSSPGFWTEKDAIGSVCGLENYL